MPETAPRRLSLLYQLYLASQASRNLMRRSMRGTDMGGEEYALYSYLFANGPRTLTQGARDLGMPLTSLATLLAPVVDRGDVERLPHPRDGRARLLRLTEEGRARLERVIPAFSAGYAAVLHELAAEGVDVEDLYAALDALRGAINAATEQLEAEADVVPG
jgi:DNA-binding MarR family transcriptional regulator